MSPGSRSPSAHARGTTTTLLVLKHDRVHAGGCSVGHDAEQIYVNGLARLGSQCKLPVVNTSSSNADDLPEILRIGA